MRIGVFGGTFDPPHIGHLVLASEAKIQLRLDLILWVLTPFPPHKQERKITDWQIRKEMVLAAIDDEPCFHLSTVDIGRPGPHYAIDTLNLLFQEYPLAELYYLIGGDSLHEMPSWRRPEEIVQVCTGLGVMRRYHEAIHVLQLEQRLPGLRKKLFFFKTPLLEISSTDIRTRINKNYPVKYFLPPKVFTYIQSHKLYGG